MIGTGADCEGRTGAGAGAGAGLGLMVGRTGISLTLLCVGSLGLIALAAGCD